MMKNYEQTYHRWRNEPTLDADTKAVLDRMGDRPEEIYEAFYRDLEFGTAGLRGIMGPGTNRMNTVVIKRVTQGIANHLNKKSENPAVAIGYDSRNNSRKFAEAAGSVLAANGIRVWIFRQLMPVPALSYVTRQLDCRMGIMITASHNPKEYNGYKVYGPDGGQILSDAATEILQEVNQVDFFEDPKSIPFEEALGGLCQFIPEEVEQAYYQAVLTLSTGQSLDGIKLVYTPLNGAGLLPVSKVLTQAGLNQMQVVPEQENPDGDFPTCPKPNPELPEVYQMAMYVAAQNDADLILATDPDSDRVGMAIPAFGPVDPSGQTPKPSSKDYRVLSGNEMATLLLDYLTKTKPMPENPLIIRTIVSTPIVDYIAKQLRGEIKKTLIGFKYIGAILTEMEKEGTLERFVFGFEEGNGFLAGPYVRDKDAVGTALLLCQMAAYHKSRGVTISDALARIYRRHGVFREKVISYEFEGAKGADTMNAIMERFRDEQRVDFLGKKPIKVTDYLEGAVHYLGSSGTSCDMAIGMKPTGLPKENIMKFLYDDSTSFVVRPSGTEPKLKIYLFAQGEETDEVQNQISELERLVREYIEKGQQHVEGL
jgi:phosphoglucomutase